MHIYAHTHGGSLHIFHGSILFRCAVEGTMGSLLYYLFQRGTLQKTLSTPLIPIVAVATILLITRFKHRISLPDTAFQPLFSIIIISLAHIDTAGRKTFLQKIKYLGEISFSIYLCHYLIILLAQKAIADSNINNNTAKEVAIFTLAIGGSILCAALIHKYIETPSRKFIIRKFA
jgi:peptidoglycan/LPS O-acetylase OafA/YrhL